jgi:hypothetical protein
MKKPIKIVLWLIAACSMIAIMIVGLEVRRIWNGYHDTIVIADSSFGSRFPDLYPDTPEMKKEIEQWFFDAIPPGTTRDEAKSVLSKSFESDLTSGKMTVVDEVGSAAGGSSTSIRIHFDERGRVKSVEVEQHIAYM